jgi:hypothetical protein
MEQKKPDGKWLALPSANKRGLGHKLYRYFFARVSLLLSHRYFSIFTTLIFPHISPFHF